jgi:hypothetical protein
MTVPLGCHGARIAAYLLLAWATEIRMRAVRQIGLMMETHREDGAMAKGGGNGSNQFQKATGSKPDPVAQPITLADAGIDKHLADKARKFAALSEEKFEALVERHAEAAASIS